MRQVRFLTLRTSNLLRLASTRASSTLNPTVMEAGSLTSKSTAVALMRRPSPWFTFTFALAMKPLRTDDEYAGQTPTDQRLGILSLELSTGPNDTDPLIVFDHGVDYVEAGLNAGDDTLVASVPAASLRFGLFSHARVKVSHVRYRVSSTMHAYGTSVVGEFNNVQVLTDGMFVDDALHDSGWFRFAFEAGGQTYGVREGASGPLPVTASSGGIGLEVVNGEAAYVFSGRCVGRARYRRRHVDCL